MNLDENGEFEDGWFRCAIAERNGRIEAHASSDEWSQFWVFDSRDKAESHLRTFYGCCVPLLHQSSSWRPGLDLKGYTRREGAFAVHITPSGKHYYDVSTSFWNSTPVRSLEEAFHLANAVFETSAWIVNGLVERLDLLESP